MNSDHKSFSRQWWESKVATERLKKNLKDAPRTVDTDARRTDISFIESPSRLEKKARKRIHGDEVKAESYCVINFLSD